MAIIASWNGHEFEISAQHIYALESLSIKAEYGTKEENINGQSIAKKQSSKPFEVSFTVKLNVALGISNVFGEAMEFVAEAFGGTSAYLYLGQTRLFPTAMTLTSAQISNVMTFPGKGDEWVSCDIKLTFKQGATTSGLTSKPDTGGGGKGANGQLTYWEWLKLNATVNALGKAASASIWSAVTSVPSAASPMTSGGASANYDHNKFLVTKK